MKYRKLAVGLSSRLLIALGISLVIAAIAGSLWGVKLESQWDGSIARGSGDAVVIVAMATASTGIVSIELEGVKNAYTISLAGDPFMLFDYLSALNIDVTSRSVKPDIRAGVVFGWGVLDASLQAIRLLPALGQVGELEVRGGSVAVKEIIQPGGSLAVIAVPGEEGVIDYNIKYTVQGYSRTSDAILLTGGLLLTIAGLVAYAFKRKRLE